MENEGKILRQALMEACVKHVKERVENLELALKSAHEASTDDTKSSAGDKYETTREMMQQDIARSQSQLIEAKKDENTLENLLQPNQFDFVQLGSLVKTDKGLYFIAIGIGVILTLDQKVFVISSQSPIGKLLQGKKVGETIVFNHVEQKLLSIN